jgi:hypothetical protein
MVVRETTLFAMTPEARLRRYLKRGTPEVIVWARLAVVARAARVPLDRRRAFPVRA